MMIFLWPKLLYLLLAEPLAVAAYMLLLRHKKKLESRYALLAFARSAMASGPRLRRHVPPLLFLLALTLMILAAARPMTVMTVPSEQQTIILAIDTSISMGLDDIPPSRFAAAKAAAYSFVVGQQDHIRVGVVSFAATASVVQAPTTQRDDVIAAINRLELQHGTAVGSAILVSLKIIFPDFDFDLNAADPRPNPSPGLATPGVSSNNQGAKSRPAQFRPVPAGSYPHAAIVLLTDGRSMVGPDPVDAARMAAERGVRVFTVGIGAPTIGPQSVGSWAAAVSFDEESLMQIANITKAKYFYADNASNLAEICNTLNSRLVFEEKQTEVTALFAVVAAVLTGLAGLLSLLWFTRVA